MKDIKNVNMKVAQKLGIPESIVKKVNSYYWNKGVADSIRSLEHSSIFIRGIGDFTVSRFKINKKILETIKAIRYLKTTDREFKRKTRKEFIDEKYRILRLLLARRNDVSIIYKQDEDKKRLKKHDTEVKSDMGE